MLRRTHVELNDGMSLSKLTKKVSVNGLKMMSNGEPLVFLPTVLMVLNYNDIMMGGHRVKNYNSSKFVETQSMHFRKPMHEKLKQIFGNQQFIKRTSEMPPSIFQSFKIIVEWNSLSKKQEFKFLSVYDLDDFGEFKFSSFFCKDIFKTEESENK